MKTQAVLASELRALRSRLRGSFGIYADLDLINFTFEVRIREKQSEMIASILDAYSAEELVAAAELNIDIASLEADKDAN